MEQNESEIQAPSKDKLGRAYLEVLLNKTMRIEITDGRTLIGQFVCTDKDENIILGQCQEFSNDKEGADEPRLLGLAMVPGRHVKTMCIDQTKQLQQELQES